MKAKIASGVRRCHAKLRQILPEESLQLLDPVGQREHDAAGTLAREPGGPELGHLVVKLAAQNFLDARGGHVRDHGADMLERTPQQDRGGDPCCGQRERLRRRTLEHAREQPAEEDEAGDADAGRDEPGRDLCRELPTRTAHHPPETLVEVHRRRPLARDLSAYSQKFECHPLPTLPLQGGGGILLPGDTLRLPP